ncbi:MAG: peptidylprolyl isomerase [bacterium]|nr:peptidylprolyl isomerase [bacterium]
MQRTGLLLSLLAMMWLASCEGKKDYIAKIGNETITEQEYRAAMLSKFRTDDNIKQRPLEERKKIAHDMAIEEAKYLEGLARKYDENPEIATNLEAAAKRRALDLLYEERIIAPVITDELLREHYDRSAKEISARHILVKKSAADSSAAAAARLKSRIDSIKTAIDNGLNFKAAAALLSEDATTAVDSGDLGWFPWGRMVDEFQRAVWSAPLRKTAGPVESPFGWHLIWVDSTRDVTGRPPFEEMKKDLAMRLREVESLKLGARARDFVNALHTEYSLQYDENALAMFTGKLTDPQMSLNKELGPMFTGDEKALVAATHKLGKITIEDMIQKVGSNAYRVDWKNPQSVHDLVNALCEPQFLEDKAGQDGYIKKAYADSNVVAQKKAAIQRMVEKVEITEKLEGSEESDKAYYERNLESFIQPETRLIREIFIKEDSAKAVRVRDRALKGEDFAKLAWQFNEKESTKRDSGRIGPFEEKRFGMIGKSAFQLGQPGAVSEVVKVGKNYSVLQLIAAYPSRTKTWDEAKGDARRENRVARTQQLQEELEKLLVSRYPLKVNDELLGSMWPLPPERQERAARDQ